MNTSLKTLEISGRKFSNLHPCIVAEIAQAHDGSLGMAHAYIDAVAEAGADAIKFQTHIASAESTLREPWRVKFSLQDDSRYEYWERMEFTEEQWYGLKNHAEDRGLIFFSSPFSEDAVEMLNRIGNSAWKIASGEVNNIPLVQTMLKYPLPIIISSGLCSEEDLNVAVNLCKDANAQIVLLQCTTEYPCPPEKIGLNQLNILENRYGVPVGLSDHSGVLATGLAAATMGISMLEVHVTFHKGMFGPDVGASLTIEDLRNLVNGIRHIEKILASPVIKHSTDSSVAQLKKIFGKSIVAARQLPAGHILSRSDIAFKKPGDGLPIGEYMSILGRELKEPLEPDDPILLKHLN